MWRPREQQISLDLHETDFARCVKIENGGRFQLPPGPVAYSVGAETRPVVAAQDGTVRVDTGQTVLLVRETDPVAVEYDSLRAADRCLMEVHLEIRVRLADAARFHTLQMIGRERLSREDVAKLIKERAKFPTRRTLRRFRAESLDGDLNARQTVEELIRNGGELAGWADDNGLLIDAIAMIECFPALDPLTTRAELDQARTAGETALEEMLERLRQDRAVRRHQRTIELLDSKVQMSRKLEELLSLCDRLERRDRIRCQQCHTVAEDGFRCRDCGQWLCRIHDREEGVCANCAREREHQQRESPRDDILKCPISGHFVVKTDTFECQDCKTVACKHCYDDVTKRCVQCAATAAQTTIDQLRCGVDRLLAELRQLPQARDLRLWCDSKREVRRGVGVAPKSDVRVFRLGDDMQFQYQAEFDGYLRLMAVQSDGRCVPLLPNEFRADYFVEGGRSHLFPDEEQGRQFRFFAREPVGLDTILAVVAPAPFRLFGDDRLTARDGPPRPSSERVQDAETTVSILRSILDQVKSGNWSCAECRLWVQT